MTLDHFGKPISTYLYECFGFFSAAEGFFFLSGFVGMLAATSKQAKDPGQSWMRKRAFKIWQYHVLTLLAIAIAATTVLTNIYPLFKEMEHHLVPSILLSALLVHTPEWLDVLPLYVIFLIVGSLVFPLYARAVNPRTVYLLFLPSLALWAASQAGLRDWLNSLFPSWVHHGDFDPFAWQFIYFLGAAVATWWRLCKEHAKWFSAFTPVVILLLVFSFLWSHQMLPLAPPADVLIDKTHLGLLRFSNFFLFVLFVSWIVRTWPSALDFRVTNLIGRHSLDVYTAHIVFIYLWLAMPPGFRYRSPWNVIVPLVVCALLWGLSKIREPRS